MGEKGFTLTELIITLVIVSMTAGIFYGLITGMTESGMFIMGGKESYQLAKEALKKMADEIRYSIRGGAQHNLGVSDTTVWQYVHDSCNSSRFTFYPDRSDFYKIVKFEWVTEGQLPQMIHPAGYYFLVRTETTGGASPTTTILAAVSDATKGVLEVRYYDAVGIRIVPQGDLTHAQAKSVARIELLLTVNTWGSPLFLSETVYVRPLGRAIPEPGVV